MCRSRFSSFCNATVYFLIDSLLYVRILNLLSIVYTQSLSRAVTRISKDLLVVSLGEHDHPAKPPVVRGQSAATTEALKVELEEWHATSGLEGVLTPDCHDPDPPITRALVDARHTFLEMCQVNYR